MIQAIPDELPGDLAGHCLGVPFPLVFRILRHPAGVGRRGGAADGGDYLAYRPIRRVLFLRHSAISESRNGSAIHSDTPFASPVRPSNVSSRTTRLSKTINPVKSAC